MGVLKNLVSLQDELALEESKNQDFEFSNRRTRQGD